MEDDPKKATSITVSRTALSKYPTSRLSAAFAPVDQALFIDESDRYLGAVARGQLQLLAEQIMYLQDRARNIIAGVEMNRRLHRIDCRFQKRPGHTYHLYSKRLDDADSEYLSMLSPDEWGNPPHPFLGSYTLNDDMSWTRVDEA